MGIERRRWIQTAICVALTYLTLGVVRPLVDGLRSRGALGHTVTVLFLAAGAAVVIAVVRRRPGWREGVVLLVAAAIYSLLLPSLDRVEERLHFLQYGIIGALVYSALDHRWVRPRRRSDLIAGACAIAIVLAIGWIDEGIQHLLPSRYYDLRDVLFNFCAGTLAVGLSIALARAKGGEYFTADERIER